MRKRTREPDGGLEELLAGEPLFAFDGELRVLGWYRGAEELTGISSAAATGRPCWELLCSFAEDSGHTCGPDCSYPRLAREGLPLPPLGLRVGTRSGLLGTIAVRRGDHPVLLHILGRDRKPAAPQPLREQLLTRRQREVLALLAEGVRAREIALRLGVTQTTVRNHIRAVLRRLDSHSQLEAVAKARRLGLVATLRRGG